MFGAEQRSCGDLGGNAPTQTRDTTVNEICASQEEQRRFDPFAPHHFLWLRDTMVVGSLVFRDRDENKEVGPLKCFPVLSSPLISNVRLQHATLPLYRHCSPGAGVTHA